MFDSFRKWVEIAIYRYEVTTALYMLEPWEKALFNAAAVSLVAMSTYTTYVYLPPFIVNALRVCGLS